MYPQLPSTWSELKQVRCPPVTSPAPSRAPLTAAYPNSGQGPPSTAWIPPPSVPGDKPVCPWGLSLPARSGPPPSSRPAGAPQCHHLLPATLCPQPWGRWCLPAAMQCPEVRAHVLRHRRARGDLTFALHSGPPCPGSQEGWRPSPLLGGSKDPVGGVLGGPTPPPPLPRDAVRGPHTPSERSDSAPGPTALGSHRPCFPGSGARLLCLHR